MSISGLGRTPQPLLGKPLSSPSDRGPDLGAPLSQSSDGRILDSSFRNVRSPPLSEPVRPKGPRDLGLWRRASDAYYRERDLKTAIRLAEQVVASEVLDGPEGWLAQRLPLRRVRCRQSAHGRDQRMYGPPPEPSRAGDEVRQVHCMIATIYRARLRDCEEAIPHYNETIVFGGTSVADDEVRLPRNLRPSYRRFDLARSDLASLKVRAATSARPKELARLENAPQRSRIPLDRWQ